ncbi:ISAzo13 family transposase [Orrella marina]|uniref:ISAzo13 family transposase n=1 Tax=Orrella marina TaxID=2163011 RepID=A0A2R4XFR2_9BURK|nr:ISAzo13 family transposase [Orrella marina]AWB32543.1 ISAzo13 family transposase [Orrella marina]
MPNISPIALRWEALNETLNERQRRLLLGAEAKALGRGGIAEVAAATGASRTTVAAGIKELGSLRSIDASEESRSTTATGSRRPGGGRKRLETTDETLVADLLALVEPTTRGDPESPLRWTCKSLRNLADELKTRHHQVSHVVVGNILRSQNFSLQANAKVLEGNQSPDRNAQFEHINAAVKIALDANEPVISVDTKKKELVGAFKNAGQRWLPRGQPDQVQVHDFVDKDLGRANPYGVYDIGADEGWVSVGTDHDTSAFAVQTIRRWWFSMGRARYPEASRLTITADGGGSNGHRVRLWKYELSQLARELGLEIHVHHFPPGTSKWNKIEHRLFSFITMNWRARPLISHEVIVNLIANTRTRSGLSVKAELDTAAYPKGISVTDAQMATIKIDRSDFHGEWNYCIRP